MVFERAGSNNEGRGRFFFDFVVFSSFFLFKISSIDLSPFGKNLSSLLVSHNGKETT